MAKPQLQTGVPGRNELCVCGSGKKFKKCCGSASTAALPPIAQSPPVDSVSSLWAAARQAFEANDLVQAEANCERLLQRAPQHADAWHLRALLAYRQSDFAAALQCVQRAIKQAPRVSTYYNSLRFIQKEQQQWDEAETAYRRALQLDPNNAMAHYNLGEMFATRGHHAEAEQCYRDALRCQPDFHEAHNNLGLLLYDAQQYDQAVVHLAQAIRLRPDEVNVYLGLARALCKLNRFAEVQAVAQEAIRRKPEAAEAWHNLGFALHGQGNVAGAMTAYETALQLNPNFCESHLNLGSIHYEQGLADVARQHFSRAVAVRPAQGLKLRHALCVPAFYDSLAHLQEERAQLIAHLDKLQAEPSPIKAPDEEVGLTPFFLAYQGENEVKLLSRIGDLLLQSCPALGNVASHCLTPKPRAEERVDIGFISQCFGRPTHIVNRVMAGIIASWPRERFRVTVLYPGELSPEVYSALREGDRLLQVPTVWPTAQQRIADAQLDILFYSDLGMDPWTYFLSFARLAPLQLVTSGHPITSGVPNVDYFLSSSNDEVPHAQTHYRERLMQWPERPVCYEPTAVAPQQKTRADFGLSEHGHVYICPMTPYKLHPANDALFGEILRADGAGELVFVTNHQTELWARLQQRFARTIPDVAQRIRYLSFLPRAEFADLLRASDCLLDTVSFNGGTTSLEALAVGTPIVTLPGEFLRQRGTFALYNRMELFDCIA
ncbi:MAG TPA: tetratricopeptide repeat protein, partial [Blastocatellia bacterium]|nr:tetratricopeptide repeat protein [Blastocatellia bacterium]